MERPRPLTPREGHCLHRGAMRRLERHVGAQTHAPYHPMLRICFTTLSFLSLLGCDSGGTVAEPGPPVAGVRLEEMVSGLERPVDIASPPDDDRLFVLEQPGRIRIIRDGEVLPEPFLDITSRVGSSGNEQGLLGIAFHPDYRSNGHFYINFTDTDGDTRVERYRVSAANPDRADAGSAHFIIGYDQPHRNHNGGQLLFGPDGMLYIPSGDGGSGGDPDGHGQNLQSLLGKMLRIDVDGGDPYAIPGDNPFVGRSDVRPEIWAYGLRNPWRVAFDGPENLLYIADVGQNAYEEISVVPADEGGLNFGWNIMEGNHCFEPRILCSRDGLVLPVVEYPRSQGISITGGYVYRGAAIPELRGRYLYADFGQSWIRALRYEGGAPQDDSELEMEGVPRITTFGVDRHGEMYVATLTGTVYKFVPDN